MHARTATTVRASYALPPGTAALADPPGRPYLLAAAAAALTGLGILIGSCSSRAATGEAVALEPAAAHALADAPLPELMGARHPFVRLAVLRPGDQILWRGVERLARHALLDLPFAAPDDLHELRDALRGSGPPNLLELGAALGNDTGPHPQGEPAGPGGPGAGR